MSAGPRDSGTVAHEFATGQSYRGLRPACWRGYRHGAQRDSALRKAASGAYFGAVAPAAPARTRAASESFGARRSSSFSSRRIAAESPSK